MTHDPTAPRAARSLGRGLAFRHGSSDEYQTMPGHRTTRPLGLEDELGLAVVIAESERDHVPIAVVGTLREGIQLAKDDLASRIRALEGGEDPLCPERYTVWVRNLNGAYEPVHTITPTEDATIKADRYAQGYAPKEGAHASAPLIITTGGFINLEQACEYRLRYVNPATTDAINGIDVLMSNGNTQLIEEREPGFDQLVEYLEDQGYTISTAVNP